MAKAPADRSSPFVSHHIVFIVRQATPTTIQDWADLAAGVQVIVPNPKTSGNGRYTYLAAWARRSKRARRTGARLCAKAVRHVPMLDAGGQAATTTFMQRQIGDVLGDVCQTQAEMVAREFGRGSFYRGLP